MKRLYLTLFCFLTLTLLSHLVHARSSGKIVFTSSRDGDREIYVMNPDGSKQTNLTRHPADDFYPTWSPNGKHILFVSNRDKVPDLYLMRADGTGVHPVFKKLAHREQPTWSPDGTLIAYARPDKNTIETAISTGRGAKQLARISFGRGYPAWSPDGMEIAYGWGQSMDIYLINVYTEAAIVLLKGRKMVMKHPAWSPGGDKIAFVALKWPQGHVGPLRVDDKMTLYVTTRDEVSVTHLVKERIVNHPTWSPHGDEILYERRERGRTQLYSVAVTGRGKPIKLTSKGNNTDAGWFDSAVLPVAPKASLLTTFWGKMKRQ